MDNVYMISKDILGEDKLLINCQWVGRSTFHTTKPQDACSKTLTVSSRQWCSKTHSF